MPPVPLFYRWRNKTCWCQPDIEWQWLQDTTLCKLIPHILLVWGKRKLNQWNSQRRIILRDKRKMLLLPKMKEDRGNEGENVAPCPCGRSPVYPAHHGVPEPALCLEFTIPIIPWGESKELLLQVVRAYRFMPSWKHFCSKNAKSMTFSDILFLHLTQIFSKSMRIGWDRGHPKRLSFCYCSSEKAYLSMWLH